jgi:hypothetical protein
LQTRQLRLVKGIGRLNLLKNNMKKIKKFNKIFNSILNINDFVVYTGGTFVIALIIYLYFLGSFGLMKNDFDFINVIKDVVPFIFIIGALILNINPIHFRERQKELFSRLGFMALTCGVLLFISGGLAQFVIFAEKRNLSLNIIVYLCVIISVFALLLFSICLSILFVESIKNTFFKKE